jgi:transcriptional regulator with XRE-family HTH domain
MVAKANKPQLKPDVRKIVGANVRRLRTDAGISQQVLADQSGIFRTYLSRAENGDANLTITVLAALAENLKVDIRDLFSE